MYKEENKENKNEHFAYPATFPSETSNKNEKKNPENRQP
jgi:hypothetical protein